MKLKKSVTRKTEKRWRKYETLKSLVLMQNLPADEYEKKIKEIVKKLEL